MNDRVSEMLEIIRDFPFAYKTTRRDEIPQTGMHLFMRRRLEKLGMPYGIVERDATNHSIMLRCQQDYICEYCQQSVPRRLREVDHGIALSRGGRHEIGNLVMSCRTCNRRKYVGKPEFPDDWFERWCENNG